MREIKLMGASKCPRCGKIGLVLSSGTCVDCKIEKDKEVNR